MTSIEKFLGLLLAVPLVLLGALPYGQATTTGNLEMSYHGHLGHLSTAGVCDHEQGMLEKWCALPDLTMLEDGFCNSTCTPPCDSTSWMNRCAGCHIGGAFGSLQVYHPNEGWYAGNPVVTSVNCFRCHVDNDLDTIVDMPDDAPINDNCMTCHVKEKAKRGYDPSDDVHMVDNAMKCYDCHFRFSDTDSDHQLAKGCTIDTSMATSWDTMDGGCSATACHGDTPHAAGGAAYASALDAHFGTVACESCHTGVRNPNIALVSRSWRTFTSGYAGSTDAKRTTPWVPVHKWYDGGGPPSEAPANGHLPILDPDFMKDNLSYPGAKIYPFNDIEVTWFVKTPTSGYDDVIPLSDVKAADQAGNSDLTTSVAEMQAYNSNQYPNATLITDTVCFNVSHSVQPKDDAFTCSDCHDGGTILNWGALGYADDPYDTAYAEQVANSYHGQLGAGTHLGMLEKWCALPNFSWSEDGINVWYQRCGTCHIGGAWDTVKPYVDCTRCHAWESGGSVGKVTLAKCATTCHSKDTAKRGDIYDADHDLHIKYYTDNYPDKNPCTFCHPRFNDGMSDHQIAKGTVLDTTCPTSKDTMQKCKDCHGSYPHHLADMQRSHQFNLHCDKIACETCHTGKRSASGLKSQDWTKVGTGAGPSPYTEMRGTNWVPKHKWYDNQGCPYGHLPILGYKQEKDWPDAKLYPFNAVTVTWFKKDPAAALDDNIIISHVYEADMVPSKGIGNQNGTTTVAEMQAYDSDANGPDYPNAQKVTRDMNFNVSHSVVTGTEAFTCGDCHGWGKFVMTYNSTTGYPGGDPAYTATDYPTISNKEKAAVKCGMDQTITGKEFGYTQGDSVLHVKCDAVAGEDTYNPGDPDILLWTNGKIKFNTKMHDSAWFGGKPFRWVKVWVTKNAREGNKTLFKLYPNP